jgi:hypothetical protein
MVMKTINSFVKPAILQTNKQAIQNYLRETYSRAKTQLNNGLDIFKTEFTEIYGQAAFCFHTMVAPVNNYLKDPVQILEDFDREKRNNAGASSTIIPLEIALLSPMEENY